MEKILTYYIFLFSLYAVAFSHKQYVHQYICKEAYHLLCIHLGHDVTGMQQHLGNINTQADHPWSDELITTGAWSEDGENIIADSAINYLDNNLLVDPSTDDTVMGAYRKKNIRTAFLYSSLGILEITLFGIGYQVSPSVSVGINLAGSWVGNGYYFPNSASGIGIKIGYSELPIWICNSLSADYLVFLQSALEEKSKKFYNGSYFDISLMSETKDEPGFTPFFSVGFCVSAAKGVSTLVSPSIKFGLEYNFIKE